MISFRLLRRDNSSIVFKYIFNILSKILKLLEFEYFSFLIKIETYVYIINHFIRTDVLLLCLRTSINETKYRSVDKIDDNKICTIYHIISIRINSKKMYVGAVCILYSFENCVCWIGNNSNIYPIRVLRTFL